MWRAAGRFDVEAAAGLVETFKEPLEMPRPYHRLSSTSSGGQACDVMVVDTDEAAFMPLGSALRPSPQPHRRQLK